MQVNSGVLNKIYRLMNRQGFALLLIYLLFNASLCPDWQASGNMTGYLEDIRTYIDDTIT